MQEFLRLFWGNRQVLALRLGWFDSYVMCQMSAIFQQLDHDKSGAVSVHELEKTFREDNRLVDILRQPPFNVDARTMLERMDVNHDHEVSFEEFMHSILPQDKINEGITKNQTKNFYTGYRAKPIDFALNASLDAKRQNTTCSSCLIS